jgi:hypothetical protein
VRCSAVIGGFDSEWQTWEGGESSIEGAAAAGCIQYIWQRLDTLHRVGKSLFGGLAWGHGAHARIGTRVGIRVHAVTDTRGGDRGVECGAQHRTLVLSSQCEVHMQLANPLSSSLPVRVPALAPDLREVQGPRCPLAVLLLHFILLDLPWSDPREIVALHLLLSEANPTSGFFAPSRCFHIYHG